MKNLLKILSLCLSVVVIMAVLAACGGKPAETTVPTTTVPTEGPGDETEPPVTQTPETTEGGEETDPAPETTEGGEETEPAPETTEAPDPSIDVNTDDAGEDGEWSDPLA